MTTLTREQIEELRLAICYGGYRSYSSDDANALCDLALQGLEQNSAAQAAKDEIERLRRVARQMAEALREAHNELVPACDQGVEAVEDGERAARKVDEALAAWRELNK